MSEESMSVGELCDALYEEVWPLVSRGASEQEIQEHLSKSLWLRSVPLLEGYESPKVVIVFVKDGRRSSGRHHVRIFGFALPMGGTGGIELRMRD